MTEDAAHGRWYFAVQVDGVDGRRTRVRTGGFASERDACRALAESAALPRVEAAARMWTVGRWLRFWLAEIERSGAHSCMRHGTTSLFAALDVATGKIIGQTQRLHHRQEFLRFLEAIDAVTSAELRSVHRLAER